MRKPTAGASRSAAVMPGARCIAPTTMRSAAAANSVSRAFGVRRRIPAIMLGSFGVSSTTAQPVNGLQRPRSPSLNLNRSE